MIINSVKADNVLKYTRLELNGLPKEGLIAISGHNESGKSALGETICFALFGRTFSLSPEELTKMIHWGETRCVVALDFTANGRAYRVERSLDDAGNQGARLTREDQGDLQARGPAAVTAEIERLAGFGYKEFIESFYLAQREIVAPHGHSAAVKAMAGLTPLEQVRAQLSDEVKTLTDDMISAERDMADFNDRLSELDIRPDHLQSLWANLSAAGTEHREKSTRARLLRHVSDQCRESVETLKSDAEPILKASINTSYQDWSAHAERLDACARHMGRYCVQQDAAQATESAATLNDFVQHLKGQLLRFAEIKDHAQAYRARLAALLGETGSDGAQAEVESLPARQTDLAHRIEAAKRSRKTARIFTMIFLVLAALAWALWALLFQAPKAPMAATLTGWLNAYVPGWQGYPTWWLVAAGILTALFLLFLIRSIFLSARINSDQNESDVLHHRIQATREEATALDNLATMPLAEAVAVLKNAKDEQIAAQAAEMERDPNVTLLEYDKLNDYRRLLTSIIARTEKDIEHTRAGMADEVAGLDRDVRELDGKVAQLHQSIPVEQERRRKAEHLRSMMDSLQTKIDASRRKIEVRNLARDLLDEGIDHVARRFNHDIRNLVGKTLPRLTTGRYEHLQIDEALRVRVFSGEKHDFLDLDEISSGTQRQIMLAVRLALSQKLVNGAVDGEQFIFLDEPFAFFDQQRMRDSLSVLPELSEDITQTWVIAQEFPDDVHFDLHIRCEHGLTDMRMDAAQAPN